jgi:predicted nucleotidyltransferase
MNPSIAKLFHENQEELAGLCKKLGVARLRLFGSATKKRPLKKSSDLDFVVAFSNDSAAGISDRFLELGEQLELLFRRKVDLLTERSLRNPFLRQAIERQSQVIYEA